MRGSDGLMGFAPVLYLSLNANIITTLVLMDYFPLLPTQLFAADLAKPV